VTAPGRETRVEAPAKLTLTLRVLGVRDDGFHDIEALTAMVSAPADRLVVRPRGDDAVTLTVSGGGPDVPHGDDNLVVRAARAVLPAGAGLDLALTKVTPSGAGLGGGSADAAAVLRVVRDRFGVPDAEVLAAAAALGSDVPVCVGGVPVVMRGRGEVLEPVVLRGTVPVVIAKPAFSCATPAVYRAWDELGGPRSHRVVAPPDAVSHLVDGLVNDLEPAAEQVEPRLIGFRTALAELAGAFPVLAGSGSAYWLPVADPEDAASTAARVRDELNVEAFAGVVLDRRAEGEA
jgi:4-diphosphocytidyl-2-C-methyl-D-erythritol kinase